MSKNPIYPSLKKYYLPMAVYKNLKNYTVYNIHVLQRIWYSKSIIIRHVPMFAIFVSAFNDEITYWRI